MSRRFILVTFFAAFILAGITSTLLGPTLNHLTAQFGIPLENGGIFFTIYSVGVTVSLVFVSWVFSSGRLAPRHVMSIGLACLAFGMLTLSTTTNFYLAALGTVVFGYGYGWFMVGPNVMISRVYPGGATAGLNALNTFFGVGAILGPQVVNVAFALDNYRFAYFFTAAICLIFILPVQRIRIASHEISGDTNSPTANVAVNWRAFIPFAILIFFYVGTEVGFGAWISPHLQLVNHLSQETANIGASLFWAGLMAGRALGTVVARYIHSLHLLMLSAASLIFGAIVVLSFPAVTVLLFVGAFLAGLGCGPIFPTTMAVISDNYPRQFAAASSWIMAFGNIGPIVIPWLQGRVGGGDSGGIVVTLVGGTVMLLLILAISRQVRDRENAGKLLEIAA